MKWSYRSTRYRIAQTQLDCITRKITYEHAKDLIEIIYALSGWTEESLEQEERRLLTERLRRINNK